MGTLPHFLYGKQFLPLEPMLGPTEIFFADRALELLLAGRSLRLRMAAFKFCLASSLSGDLT